MNDLMRYQFPVQSARDENIGPTRQGVDVALMLSKSVLLDRPQVTIFVTLPELGPVIGPTGKSSVLDFPVELVVDAASAAPGTRPFYSSLEVAQVLGMSVDEIEWWVEAGLIPARRAKGQVRISAKWLDQYRPTAEAVKWMGSRLSTDELVSEIRQGRRLWTWPPEDQVRGA